MPTGYTAPIEDDPDFTFEQYLWRCVRAMGVCISMRDMSMNAPVPDSFPLDDYRQKRVDQCRAEVAKLEAMTMAEAEEEAEESFRSMAGSYEEIDIGNQKMLARYEAIKAQVEAWPPPTSDHENFKAFMLEQIEISSRYMRPEKDEDKPKKQTGAEWLHGSLMWARRDLKRAEEALTAAIENNKKNNQWLADVRASVPQP